jgi:hypothetical protein
MSTVSGLFESAKAKACADVVELEGVVVVELEELDVLVVEELEELVVEEDIAVLVVDMLEDTEVLGDAGEANK